MLLGVEVRDVPRERGGVDVRDGPRLGLLRGGLLAPLRLNAHLGGVVEGRSRERLQVALVARPPPAEDAEPRPQERVGEDVQREVERLTEADALLTQEERIQEVVQLLHRRHRGPRGGGPPHVEDPEDLPGPGPVATVDVEGRDRERERPDVDAEDGGDDLLEDRPLKGVDAAPPPDEVVGADGDVEVEPPEARLEVEPVVTRDVLAGLGVRYGVVDRDDRAAAGAVRPEVAHDPTELVDDVPVTVTPGPSPEPRPVASAPRPAVVGELRRPGEVVGEPLNVVAAREDPDGLRDLRRHGRLPRRVGDVAVAGVLERDADVEQLLDESGPGGDLIPFGQDEGCGLE